LDAAVLGELLKNQGDAEGAKASYQQAIDFADADSAPLEVRNLGRLLARNLGHLLDSLDAELLTFSLFRV
jgi:hypothetical protein